MHYVTLAPEISGEFFVPLLRGVEAEASRAGFRLLIYATQGNANYHTGSLPIGEQNTDGVLVFVDSVSKVELAHFNRMGFPVVLIHRTPPKGLDIPCVTIENKQGARRLVDHLIEMHGYRRIAFLTGEAGHEDSYWRKIGYRESLEAHNISFDPELVAAGGFDREQAQSTIEAWLAKGKSFEAVFSSDDESAIGVLAALSQAGKRVPEDVAVVGFDDMALSQYLNPPLTTVRAPTEQVGRESVKQLMCLVRGDSAEPLLLLPTEPVIRRSCGCG